MPPAKIRAQSTQLSSRSKGGQKQPRSGRLTKFEKKRESSRLRKKRLPPLSAAELLGITNRNKSDSPVLRLPSELRNMIWDYTFQYNNEETSTGDYRKPQQDVMMVLNPPGSSRSNSPPPRYHLLRVCRQIYEEIMPIMLSLNNIMFNSMKAMEIWLKVRPEAHKHITSITLLPYHSYANGHRNSLRNKLPSLKDIKMNQRATTHDWVYKEKAFDAFEAMVKAKEGQDM